MDSRYINLVGPPPPPFPNPSLFFEISFFLVLSGGENGTTRFMTQTPWWIHLVALGLVALNVPVQEAVKAHDRKKWILFQKRTKLEFNTKLGMHSPL
jgi:hypothetical protein